VTRSDTQKVTDINTGDGMITLIWICQCELELAISTLETESGGDLRHFVAVAGQLVGE